MAKLPWEGTAEHQPLANGISAGTVHHVLCAVTARARVRNRHFHRAAGKRVAPFGIPDTGDHWIQRKKACRSSRSRISSAPAEIRRAARDYAETVSLQTFVQ